MEAQCIHKEMGLTHEDLLRFIPILADENEYQIGSGFILIQWARDRSVRINYAPQRLRKIAMFALPVTDIDLVFSGFDQQQIDEFIFRFDRIFQRGGG